MRFFSSSSPFTWAASTLALLPAVLSSPILSKRAISTPVAINTNFPDPSFVGAADGYWYAFGTNGNGKRVQVARSTDFANWDLLDVEALPTVGSWETEKDHWAPDVVMRVRNQTLHTKRINPANTTQDDGKYVMYYSGESKSNPPHHCVGTAVADYPEGPYVPSEKPLSCRLDGGGSIDPSGFLDADGSRYVVFKVDGNSIGHGGDCNNGKEPLVGTPIMLQKLQADAITPDGDAVQILDRSTADGDGPLVEAPNLILKDGTYFLFYSTHCFTDPLYDVRYATASSIAGPYYKGNDQLIKTGDFGLTSPGGATVCGCGDRMLLHGFCDESKSSRCTYWANVSLSGSTASIV